MPNPTNITYGAYSFRDQAGPIPHPSINVNFVRAEDGTHLVTRYSMTLENVLTPIPTGEGGYTNIDAMQDALVSGFSLQGQHLQITCNGNTLLSAYPRITDISLNKSDDNWVYTTPYSIQLEWDGENITGNIWVESIQETWNVEFSDEAGYYNWLLPGNTGDYNSVLVNLNHTVGAKGIAHYTSTGLYPPHLHAKNFVISRLGYNGSEVAQVGVLNLRANTFAPYNHMRVVNEDILGGEYNVTETWLLTTGYRAVEDFTVNLKYGVEDAIAVVDVQGSIKGMESRDYGASSGAFSITEAKWNAASGYWATVKPKLYGRAQYIATTEGYSTLNPIPLDKTVGHNPMNGVINYGYTYDTRACNFVTGSISERISVSDSYPTDVFGTIVIPGRANGPILQDIGTITEHKRSVSIDVVMAPPTDCNDIAARLTSKPTGAVNSLLCALESDIVTLGVQVFKSADSDTFDIKTGKYSRSVEWTFSYCGGDPPSTSFCN